MLKRDLPVGDATRYVARLAALGARVHVEPMAAAAAPAAGAWPPIAPPPEPALGGRPADRATVEAPPPAAPAPSAEPSRPAPSKELALQPIEAPAAEGEITCPTCGEQQSHRVLCRKCATNMPMGIAARQEEAEQRRAERQAALQAHRAARAGRSDTDGGARFPWPIGLGFSGRLARLPGATAGVWLLTGMLLLTTGFFQRPSIPRMLLLGLGMLAMFFFSMRGTVLRCHDCGRHGWWALFVLVPYVGSLAGLLFTFLPGDPHENDYGPPPPKGQWRWLLVAIAVLLVSSVMLVRAALGAMQRQAEAQQVQQAEDAEDELVELGSTDVGAADINAAFQRDYARAAGHKAFAVSSKTAYGWAGNAGSVQDAVREAPAQCNARRAAYTAHCRVVHIDGQGAR